MKIHRLYLLLIPVILLNSCDFLNYDETTGFSQDYIFSDFNRSKNFLSNIYNRVPSGFNSVGGAMRASGADNAEEIYNLEEVQQFNDGSWSAINPLDSQWGNLYDGIRATNRFLKEFDTTRFDDRQYNNDYDQIIEQARLYPAQARFLRAYFYFELIKRYDHVPLITNLLTPEESNSVAPSSYQEITDFIVSECNTIISVLPVSYESVPNNETGRATRGAAMALKSRALLYAASPLHSSSGDTGKWEAAASAAKAIIDSAYYTLEDNYSDVINNRTSSELIFERRNSSSNIFERSNFPVGFEGSNPGTAPTQNLVDAYGMQESGLNIENSNSGYDPSNPYQGRDPRLYQTVIINNSNWKGRPVKIWNGGRDGPPQDRATETGYYLKKQVIESVSLDPNNTTEAIHTWVHFRYGGILLDYAEAMNEAYGPDNSAGMGMTARQAVNMIRNRVNMPNFSAGMSQAQFREKLRNERRVELAFEDHRFWDIRRWQIGPSTTDIYGMKITRNDNGSFTYNRNLVEERVWEDRMYLYPIPQEEIFINDALNQNPGW
jgi:hypothetical protein